MLDWPTRTVGSWRWTIQPDWTDVLLDEQGLRIAAWQRQGHTSLVKTSSQRTVYRVALPRGAIYVKQHPIANLRAYLRQWLRPSKARIEAENALALLTRGLATIAPIAIGEEAGGASCLVTLDLRDVAPLHEFIDAELGLTNGARPVADRHRLAQALGGFLAKLHRAGIAHGDLHPGNVVVRWDDAEPALFLIDLHLVRIGQPLAWPAARDNLLLLNRWFIQKVSRSDRCRFWHAYLAGRVDLPDLRANARDLARALEARTWSSCLAFWRKRDARCLGNGKYFQKLHGPGGVAHAVSDVPANLLATLLQDPEAPFQQADQILKHSRSSTVALVSLDLGQGQVTCVYKKFVATKWSDPWVHLARSTPAMRSWVSGHRLRECGLPTPRPLVAIDRRTGVFTRECYLLTTFLPHARDLHATLAEHAGPEWSSTLRRRALLEQLARRVRRLHECQLSHRDLKAANVLATRNGNELGLHFIDLVGVERWRKLPPARRVQNLARLNASSGQHPEITRTDKLRFLRTYLQWGLRGQEGWKSCWRAIARATEQKLAKNRRQGRPIS